MPHRCLVGIASWIVPAALALSAHGPSQSILESERATGPWKLVVYLKDFGEQAYFVNIPSKFLSPDGRSGWLLYAANFSNCCKNWPSHRPNPAGSRYGMCWQEIRFL